MPADLDALARDLVLTMNGATYSSTEDWSEKTARLIHNALQVAVVEEREACAREAEIRFLTVPIGEYIYASKEIAAAIRARGAR